MAKICKGTYELFKEKVKNEKNEKDSKCIVSVTYRDRGQRLCNATEM